MADLGHTTTFEFVTVSKYNCYSKLWVIVEANTTLSVEIIPNSNNESDDPQFQFHSNKFEFRINKMENIFKHNFNCLVFKAEMDVSMFAFCIHLALPKMAKFFVAYLPYVHIDWLYHKMGCFCNKTHIKHIFFFFLSVFFFVLLQKQPKNVWFFSNFFKKSVFFLKIINKKRSEIWRSNFHSIELIYQCKSSHILNIYMPYIFVCKT